MRIVIDMQGAQTASRFCGIGRYSLSLAQAIALNRGEHEVILALSGLFPDTIEPIRTAFNGLLPQENIRVWYAPGPVRECGANNEWRREVAELIRGAFLANLKPDVIHLSSLFEGYTDDAVTGIGCFDPTTPVSVSFYDLIPILNPAQDMDQNLAYAHHYRRNIEYLRRASLMLATSEFACQEGQSQLDVANDKVVNISTAADAHFHPVTVDNEQAQDLRKKFDLTRPFVLYTGGADEGKNLPRLIRAYAQLSPALRKTHQLVFAGKLPEGEIHHLQTEAKSVGLFFDELLFTGYITDDELLYLYNLSKLFVFPSWHEEFALPALEAMSCGAPVVGANTTSMPEVIGRDDALFDPYDETAINQKLAEVLENDAFRCELGAHGLQQAMKFSWNECGRRAIAAFDSLYAKKESTKTSAPVSTRRLKLAFVSPLPPERSGIADYSAELLPELAKYYDIEVVIAQKLVDDVWIQANCPIRDVQWLRANAHQMDRVLYQFGNSPFHQHMLPLLEEVPGTVVLHDFFLNGLLAYLEERGIVQQAWAQELYCAHGYAAVRERYCADNVADRTAQYPVNLSVLQYSQGVIVHSDYSRKLAAEWYGKDFAANWSVIPLLRTPCIASNRAQARAALGLEENDFVVCSFGFLTPNKLNDRLLAAWLHSRLAQDARCVLVFVGENDGGEYGQQLIKNIRTSGLVKRIRITGYADVPTFRNYLAAADMGVQLRTHSRGETSAAVMDCMNHALPVIVNANGSMADLPINAVWMVPDIFEDHQLVEALETLWQETEKRTVLGKSAQEIILNRHAPDTCAKKYAEAIEQFHADALVSSQALTKSISAIERHRPTDTECRSLAETIALSLPLKQPKKQLLLDISATGRTDLKTGIERVARGLIMAMLETPPAGYRVEPVYLSYEGDDWYYKYASRYTLGLLDCPQDALVDEVVEPRSGDLLLVLDISGQMLIDAEAAGLFNSFRNGGVELYSIVYDLLPIQMPQFFPPGADLSHSKWLTVVTRFDGAVCISKAVAEELSAWHKDKRLEQNRPFRIGWFNLGADMEKSAPTSGLPKESAHLLTQICSRTTFLMVGTIEPRKGYLQTIEAFNLLWEKGINVNLVIVGKEGWRDLPKSMRRTTPEIVERLRLHPESGQRLFWLQGISDEYLDKVYASSSCLIAASAGEGFGLPLIEAAHHGLPCIARDIPVFREVAGDNACYFSGPEPKDLTSVLEEYMICLQGGQILDNLKKHTPSWQESAASILSVLLGERWSRISVASSARKTAKAEHYSGSQVN